MNRACGALLLWASLTTGNASAYCQATTCDPTDPAQRCQRDPVTKCLTTGEPLRWASDCLTISVQADGAPKAGIDYDAARASVLRAFAAWTNVDCGGERPSLRVEISPKVSCDASEYSSDRRNANIVMFRENEWPYAGAEDALGLTRVRFDLDGAKGELWDADIEVNAVTEPLSAGLPQSHEVDLDSLLTHEAGHALGLGHTLMAGATMAAGYTLGSDALRTPEHDDIEGICAIYPPDRKVNESSCEPRHGFSELCAADQPEDPIEEPGGGGNDVPADGGCSFSAVHGRSHVAFDWLAAAIGLNLLARRRRRSSSTCHHVVPCDEPALRR